MAEVRLHIEDVHAGLEVPATAHVLTRTDLVRYAGASGDFNPMHHDEVKAKAAGQPSVFGHGMLSMGLLGSAIDAWAGVGRLTAFRVRFVRQTWPGEELRSAITVTAVDQASGTARLDVRLLNQEGEEKVAGEATVKLPARTSPADLPGTPLAGTFDRLADLMQAVAAQFPDHDALISSSETLTFGQWWQRAGGGAELLRSRGLGQGDVILFLLPTCMDYAIATVAAHRLGAVPTGLNTRLGTQEIAAIIDHAQPSLIVADASLAAKLPVKLPASVLGPVIDREEFSRANRESADPELPDPSPDDPAVIVWTSGTTGLPKGAWFSHRRLKGIAVKAGDMAQAFDRRLSSTPFVHAGFMTRLWEQFGFVMALTLTPEPWDARQVLEILKSQRITMAGGVPTQWTRLLRLPELDRAAVPTLRVATTSTAPASPELIEEIQRRLEVPVITRYASTESGTATGTRVDDPPMVAFRTVGRPQTGVELSIVDESGGPVPQGEVGRVRIRHDATMNGYWRDPERTAETITDDGWLVMGDLGRIDENGNLVLVGRKSDMYIRGGYNVYPLEVENVLSTHPKVDQVAILGLPAPSIGEIGVAVVVPADPDDPPTLEELREWSKRFLADYKAPDELRLAAVLPRNAVLKVDRPALRRSVS